MKVLVIGGTRFIGKEIVRLLAECGHEITLFHRGKTGAQTGKPGTMAQIREIFGDVDHLGSHRKALLEAQPDVVVHCIAFTEKHAGDCVALFKNTNTHVIVLSSMDCYDAFQLLVRDQDASDFPVTESSPTTPIRYYWRGILDKSSDDYDKNLMTDVFQRASREKIIIPTILRLPMVYGPGDYQFPGRHGPIIRAIHERKEILKMNYLEQGQIFTHGYIENVAQAVVHACRNSVTYGKIYNLGETQVRTRRRWAELYAIAASWKFDFEITEPTPPNGAPQNFIADCSLFRRETGFEDRVSLEDGIRQTLAYGLKHNEIL